MTRIRVLAPFLVVLSLAACTGTDPKPAPTTAGQGPAPASASPSPAVTYEHKVIDLCEKVDLAPLAPLRLTLREKRAAQPLGVREHEGDSCLHEMTTAEGKIARLTVSAVVTGTPDQARGRLDAATGGTTAIGPVAGPWQQGVVHTLDTEQGYKHSELEVRAVSGNLYLSVWLAVGGDEYTPAGTLQPPVTKIAETTFATVTEAWAR
jgi:hypothetical protein